MLLAAFAYLPASVQARVAATLCTELATRGEVNRCPTDQECEALLASLNPVLTWCPLENQVVLPEAEWQRVCQFVNTPSALPCQMLA